MAKSNSSRKTSMQPEDSQDHPNALHTLPCDRDPQKPPNPATEEGTGGGGHREPKELAQEVPWVGDGVSPGSLAPELSSHPSLGSTH